MDPTFPTTAPLWTVAGWTMVHLLSVGAVIGLIAALGRGLLKQARPELRYGVALACLVALGVSPGAIFVWLYEPVRQRTSLLIRPVANRKPAGSGMPRRSRIASTPSGRNSSVGLSIDPPATRCAGRSIPSWRIFPGFGWRGRSRLWSCWRPA